MDNPFKVHADYQPSGDQPQAIAQLVKGIRNGETDQVLKGVTGSGKTFTMAHVIEQTGRPTLVLAHNKTLAAQLFSEFKALFPDNAVEFFISYYDYYQPEAYIVNTDTFIEKDSAINDDIDKMRHSATISLLQRPDVIIVSSVSCIYGIGSPEAYLNMRIQVSKGMEIDRDQFLKQLVEIQYDRSDIDFRRGTFRVRGEVVDVFPASEQKVAVRFEFFGDTVEAMVRFDPLTGEVLAALEQFIIFPGSHWVTAQHDIKGMIEEVQQDLFERLQVLRQQNKLVEAQRLETRTLHDIELLQEIGRCPGIENYSRYFSGRKIGEPPPTLIDYFPDDFLLFIDESHVTVPQVRAMYRGDRSRKENLVQYGFRLPAALDNRPLQFEEFEKIINQVIYVSATPGNYESEKLGGVCIEQIIRPTGLLDPPIEIRPAANQVEDLFEEIQMEVAKGGRVLVTTLTKKMSEDLAEYYQSLGLKVEYLHSEVTSMDRIDIIRRLRMGAIEVLVGVNLLREGLDLPEVCLVGILDADKEGFLRSFSALIQTVGRAARNENGRVLFYADKRTKSIELVLSETERRRRIQMQHNRQHNLIPQSIIKGLPEKLCDIFNLNDPDKDPNFSPAQSAYLAGFDPVKITAKQLHKELEQVERLMKKEAKALNFEKAAELRDRLFMLRNLDLNR